MTLIECLSLHLTLRGRSSEYGNFALKGREGLRYLWINTLVLARLSWLDGLAASAANHSSSEHMGTTWPKDDLRDQRSDRNDIIISQHGTSWSFGSGLLLSFLFGISLLIGSSVFLGRHGFTTRFERVICKDQRSEMGGDSRTIFFRRHHRPLPPRAKWMNEWREWRNGWMKIIELSTSMIFDQLALRREIILWVWIDRPWKWVISFTIRLWWEGQLIGIRRPLYVTWVNIVLLFLSPLEEGKQAIENVLLWVTMHSNNRQHVLTSGDEASIKDWKMEWKITNDF